MREFVFGHTRADVGKYVNIREECDVPCDLPAIRMRSRDGFPICECWLMLLSGTALLRCHRQMTSDDTWRHRVGGAGLDFLSPRTMVSGYYDLYHRPTRGTTRSLCKITTPSDTMACRSPQ